MATIITVKDTKPSDKKYNNPIDAGAKKGSGSSGGAGKVVLPADRKYPLPTSYSGGAGKVVLPADRKYPLPTSYQGKPIIYDNGVLTTTGGGILGTYTPISTQSAMAEKLTQTQTPPSGNVGVLTNAVSQQPKQELNYTPAPKQNTSYGVPSTTSRVSSNLPTVYTTANSVGSPNKVNKYYDPSMFNKEKVDYSQLSLDKTFTPLGLVGAGQGTARMLVSPVVGLGKVASQSKMTYLPVVGNVPIPKDFNKFVSLGSDRDVQNLFVASAFLPLAPMFPVASGTLGVGAGVYSMVSAKNVGELGSGFTVAGLSGAGLFVGSKTSPLARYQASKSPDYVNIIKATDSNKYASVNVNNKPINFVEDVTVKTSLKELRSFEGTKATNIHVTTADFPKVNNKVSFVTEARPEGATDFRVKNDLLNFYTSSPEKTGEGRAYLGYAGIKGESSSVSSKGVSFSNPTIKALVFDDTISKTPKSATGSLTDINRYQLGNSGKTFVPAENFYGSPEGQFIKPSKYANIPETVGTQITQTGKVKVGFYPEEKIGLFGKYTKYSRVEFIPAEASAIKGGSVPKSSVVDIGRYNEFQGSSAGKIRLSSSFMSVPFVSPAVGVSSGLSSPNASYGSPFSSGGSSSPSLPSDFSGGSSPKPSSPSYEFSGGSSKSFSSNYSSPSKSFNYSSYESSTSEPVSYMPFVGLGGGFGGGERPSGGKRSQTFKSVGSYTGGFGLGQKFNVNITKGIGIKSNFKFSTGKITIR